MTNNTKLCLIILVNLSIFFTLIVLACDLYAFIICSAFKEFTGATLTLNTSSFFLFWKMISPKLSPTTLPAGIFIFLMLHYTYWISAIKAVDYLSSKLTLNCPSEKSKELNIGK